MWSENGKLAKCLNFKSRQINLMVNLPPLGIPRPLIPPPRIIFPPKTEMINVWVGSSFTDGICLLKTQNTDEFDAILRYSWILNRICYEISLNRNWNGRFVKQEPKLVKTSKRATWSYYSFFKLQWKFHIFHFE